MVAVGRGIRAAGLEERLAAEDAAGGGPEHDGVDGAGVAGQGLVGGEAREAVGAGKGVLSILREVHPADGQRVPGRDREDAQRSQAAPAVQQGAHGLLRAGPEGADHPHAGDGDRAAPQLVSLGDFSLM